MDYFSTSQKTRTLTTTFANMAKFCTNAYTHTNIGTRNRYYVRVPSTRNRYYVRVPNTIFSIHKESTQILQKQNERNYSPLYLSPFCHLENHTGDQTMVLSSDAEFLPDQSIKPNHSPLLNTIMKLSHKQPSI